MPDSRVGDLVEHLFRHEAGRLVAVLTRHLGPARLDLAEEAVQEALLAALATWPFRGVPDRPAAWLFQAARNRALDALRRGATAGAATADIISLEQTRLARLPEPALRGELDDDLLGLMFACCHPDLRADDRVALTLKTVCGFSVGEIARGFLRTEATLAQRLVRAKRRLAAAGATFEVPGGAALQPRLAAVLRTIYLMFNEGYYPSEGDAAVRDDLCAEAVRLAELLAEHPATAGPEVDALCALLLLQGARLPARVDAAGELLLLDGQDRGRWRQDWIARGFARLRGAMAAEALGVYHAQAGIAGCHAAAARFEDTDWAAIVHHYGVLRRLEPSTLLEINRAAALAMRDGPQAGLALLDDLPGAFEGPERALALATRGDLLRRAGRHGEAAACFGAALECPLSAPVRRFFERRLSSSGCESTC